MKTEKIYTVPQLVKQLNLTERAIRFYESKELLEPRRAGNTRILTYKDRARLIIIKRAKKLGFSLSDIKAYLDLYDVDHKHEQQAKIALKGIKERIKQLKDQQKEIKVIIYELKKLETQIESTNN